jgi:hypothetical protein
MLKILGLGVLPVILLGATACTVDSEKPGRPDYDPPPISYCTREYSPVCARRGDDYRTFGNSCEARSAGYRIIEPNACRSVGEDRGECGNEYQPVCATNGRITRTMRNQCIVNMSGFWIVHEGPC